MYVLVGRLGSDRASGTDGKLGQEVSGGRRKMHFNLLAQSLSRIQFASEAVISHELLLPVLDIYM